MYAIIETGGKQYKVEQGDEIYIEKLEGEEDSALEFNVIALGGDEGFKLGSPYVKGAKVTGKLVKTGKGKKLTIFTYKRKKGQKRKMGHRQPYSKVLIESIQA